MCWFRPACRNEGVNISSAHSAIGSVSRIDRPTPRNAIGRRGVETGRFEARGFADWLAIKCPLDQDGETGKPIPARQQNRHHACNRHHRRRSLHKSHGKKRQEPHRSPHEKADKEKQRRRQMLKLRRAHPGHKKRRAKIDPSQKSQRQRTRPQRTRRLADPYQPARPPLPRRSLSVGGVRRSATPVRPAHRVKHQRRRQQHLNPAH